jgi:hypothetical protein
MGKCLLCPNTCKNTEDYLNVGWGDQIHLRLENTATTGVGQFGYIVA